MIRRSILRLAAMLAAASVLGVSHAMSPAAEGTTSSCASGKTSGAWELPSAGNPGGMNGLLGNEGRPRFRVRAVLLPDRSTGSAGPRKGQLRGMLEVLTPNGPMPFARVDGEWISNAQGQGRFHARIVRSGPSVGLPILLLGAIQGRFDDPSASGPGRYRGRWKICI